jgi:hypothetical protein
MRPQDGPEANEAMLQFWCGEVATRQRSSACSRIIVRNSINLRPFLSIRIPKLRIHLIDSFPPSSTAHWQHTSPKPPKPKTAASHDKAQTAAFRADIAPPSLARYDPSASSHELSQRSRCRSNYKARPGDKRRQRERSRGFHQGTSLGDVVDRCEWGVGSTAVPVPR